MPARTLAKGIVYSIGLLGLTLLPTVPGVLTSASKATLQTQADQLSRQIAVQSTQIRTIAVQAASARQQVLIDRTNLTRVTAELAQARTHLVSEKQLLVRYAVAKFTDAPGSSSVISTLNTNQNNVAAQSAYESVASGYIVNIITGYRRDQQVVTTLVNAAAHALASASQAQQRLSQELASLQVAITNEQSSLSSMHGQIAQLVQQQLAQQAAQQAAQQQARAQAAQQQAAQQAAQQQARAQAAQQQALAQQAPPTSSQGAPSASGVAAAVSTGGAAGQWGGTPAPPSPQAFSALRNCEAGGNYQENTGNGYYGAYQFSAATWAGLGFSGLPSSASPATQNRAAQIEQQQGGWSAWPECSLILGLG
ncbi:MAG: transglycosylase family protein [Ferrimicrobium sp.]|jgi:septal ring factor EnvC (AmiA/AmiB activator)|nr:transglycosylase family protein [Ferrimicrobium sp.]